MSSPISKIGVFTSGGDSPGMNAAIRAVVRAAIYYDKSIYGIIHGYKGLILGRMNKLGVRSVGNIIHHGGTILKSARSQDFYTTQGRAQAFDQLKRNGIDALVGIGGDGTFTGMHKFYEEHKIPCVCIPATIDNDLSCTDYTIGYDTATNTVVDAIDKIRDTAISHNRLFFIEVMGRRSGYIGLHTGLAGGAVAIIIPEEKITLDQLFNQLEETQKSQKKSSLIIVAEGSSIGGAVELAKKFSEKNSYYETKVTILGHIQRGGKPTCFDRVLASKLGIAAVEGLLAGQQDVMVGIQQNKISYTSYDKVMEDQVKIDHQALRIAKILSI